MKSITGIWNAGRRFFLSLRLAVFLLIVLAVVSVFGTFIPQGQDPDFYIRKYGVPHYRYLKFLGVIDLYHSWGFRAITALLAVNLLVCSIGRFKRLMQRTLRPNAEKTGEAIKNLRIHNELPASPGAEILERSLRDRKYKVVKRGSFIYGFKGKLGLWGDMVTHASILLVLLGGIIGSLGMVGTVNVYEGDYSDRFYDWGTGKDKPLNFRLYVDKFTLEHYPVEMKVNVRDINTGARLGTFNAIEGKFFSIPGTKLKIKPENVDMEKREAILYIYDGERFMGSYNTGAPDGGLTAPPSLGYIFTVGSFTGPFLKNIASSVRIVKDGREADRAVIEINNPMKYGGMTIYQTSYARDALGRYYSGFQLVEDPGIPVVWTGFVLLMAGLFLSFFFYHR
ncbi:MAG: cytochrome c biogenesis protein ResB, partial [Nitrospirota bacterium]